MAAGDAGWAHADPQYSYRRNREWILGRLLHPVYDHDIAETVTATAVAIQGEDVVTGETTHYTCGAAVNIVHRLHLNNNDTVRNQVSLHLVPSGGSRQVANCIFDDELLPGEAVTLEGPWFLDSGDTIRSISAAASANEVALRGEALELDTAIDFVGLVVVDGTALTNSLVSKYSCPASTVEHALAIAIAVCNTDTATRTVTIEIRPSGGSQSNKQNVLTKALRAGESYIFGGFALMPGDAVYAMASTGSVVSFRISPVEFSALTT